MNCSTRARLAFGALSASLVASVASVPAASAAGSCGKDYTPPRACPLNGSYVTARGTLVASDEIDYYAFHAQPNTMLKFTVVDLEDPACNDGSNGVLCGAVSAEVIDPSLLPDVTAGTGGSMFNEMESGATPGTPGTAQPWLVQAGDSATDTYYLVVTGTLGTSSSGAPSSVPYEIRLSADPGIAWPANRTKTSSGHIPPGDTQHIHQSTAPRASRTSSWLKDLALPAILLAVWWLRHRRRKKSVAEEPPPSWESAYTTGQAEPGPDQESSYNDPSAHAHGSSDGGYYEHDTTRAWTPDEEAEPAHPLRWALKALELQDEATLEDVRAARRRLAARYHPDNYNSNEFQSVDRQWIHDYATKKMKEVNEAADALEKWFRQTGTSS